MANEAPKVAGDQEAQLDELSSLLDFTLALWEKLSGVSSAITDLSCVTSCFLAWCQDGSVFPASLSHLVEMKGFPCQQKRPKQRPIGRFNLG